MNAAQVQADRIRAEREAAGTLGKVAPAVTYPNQTTPHDIEPWAERLAELRAEPDCDPSGQMADEAADRYERERDGWWAA